MLDLPQLTPSHQLTETLHMSRCASVSMFTCALSDACLPNCNACLCTALSHRASDRMYRRVHGDKDTFALAFAMAGKAHEYNQMSVPPGG